MKREIQSQTKPLVCKRVREVEETYSLKGHYSSGVIHAVNVFKVFPPSKPGKTGFKQQARPATTDFDDWFDYFVQRIGAAVEQLNAWQFNLLQGDKPDTAKFAKALDALAVDMGIGQKGSHNPSALIWPLSGVYVCDLLLTKSSSAKALKGKRTQPARVVLITAFETEANYQVVTNCSVVLIEPSQKDKPTVLLPPLINYDSSSSSSLATSSSSSVKQL